MAKDDEWLNLLREVAADTSAAAPAARVDMGPEARRAAAGMPPGPRIGPDPNPSPAIGGPYGYVYGIPGKEPPAEAYGPDGKMKPGVNLRVRPADPMEVDTGAQMIASGLMGYGAGAAVAPALGWAPKALQTVLSSGVEGAVASKTQGGRADVGAAIGAGMGGLGAAGAGRAARADKDLFREIGRAAPPSGKEALTGLGPNQIVKTARDFGIADAKSWADRAAASGAAKQQVGEQIGSAYKQLDAAGAARPTTSVVQALEQLKGELGKTTEGQKLAELVTAKQEALRQLYPQTIPASALNKEIGDLEAIGYSGAGAGTLSPAAAKQVARMSAKAMNGELDTALAGARKDPVLGKAVESLDQLNPTYRSLIAIDTIAKRQAAKEPFKQTLGEKFMAAPGKTSGQLAVRAATAPLRGGMRAAEALGAGLPAGGPAAAAAGIGRPERKVAPAVVPIVQSLSEHNGADLSKHVEAAVFQ